MSTPFRLRFKISGVASLLSAEQERLPAKDNLSISIKIANRIMQCQQSWDSLLPVDHHLRSAHLNAFERANIDDIENNYVAVFLKEKLIGLVYLQQFSFQHKHLNFSNPGTLLSKAIKIILPAQLPLLVCGNLFRINFQGFYFKTISHQAFLFDVVRLFIQQQKRTPWGIMIKDCDEAFIEQGCRLFGYYFFNGDVTMEISRRAHWQSFDNYLNDLKKDYLKRAKKILHSFDSIETKELTAPEILNSAPEIDKLYWNVVNKQTIKLGTVNTNYFCELKNDLQQDFEFHALYLNNTMVGFYTFIFYTDEMETHYIGMDYEANKKYRLYFNILFAGIKRMIERRDTKMELGRTAREAKANLGAMPKQIFNYIKVRNPFIKIILNHFLKKFNQVEDKSMANRNPLK